jgi:hypothetical protein
MLYVAEFCKKNFFKGFPISADILKSTYDQRWDLGVPYYQGDHYFYVTLSKLRHPTQKMVVKRFVNISRDIYGFVSAENYCLARSYKTFYVCNFTNVCHKLECLSLGRPFQSSLMFPSKAGAYLREAFFCVGS